MQVIPEPNFCKFETALTKLDTTRGIIKEVAMLMYKSPRN